MLRKIHTPAPRAKIFQAFDALPGLREALRQAEIEHERLPAPELSEDRLAELDYKVRTLTTGTHIELTCFENGFYRSYEGTFRGLNTREKTLLLDDIPIALPSICNIHITG